MGSPEPARTPDDFLVGALLSLRPLVERVAASEAPVLLRGESGTGKELLARTVHSLSHRARGPFVAINCAALPAALLESELFGHVRGAFTDARSDHDGLFVQATGGSLFLDEVGELPVELQPRLLRALQERRVRPVGGSREVPFDARIIAATHRDLAGAVSGGRFREDLLYRLDVLRLELPPLRARGQDVITLARFFLDRASKGPSQRARHLSAGAEHRLLAWGWPGNVRELENVVERALVSCETDELPAAAFPADAARPQPTRHPLSDFPTLAALITSHLALALERTGGNKTRAAALLGVDRRTLYRMLERRRAR